MHKLTNCQHCSIIDIGEQVVVIENDEADFCNWIEVSGNLLGSVDKQILMDRDKNQSVMDIDDKSYCIDFENNRYAQITKEVDYPYHDIGEWKEIEDED